MNEILKTGKSSEDIHTNSIRPQSFDDYIGQSKVVDKIKIFIEAAKKRDESLDHVLLSGPPGLGKTTMANLISGELGVNLIVTAGPALERSGDVAAILTSLKKGDILFIDEIHRLSRNVEETLYSAMEDFKLDIIIGKGPSARTIRIDISPFTLIGATTQPSKVSSPLRTRFGVLLRLDFYSTESLKTIVTNLASRIDIEIDDKGALEIAKRGRGTPRIVTRILRRVRDYAEIRGKGIITYDIACNALELLDIDEKGLDELDRRILDTIIKNYEGGPVGLDTLAVAVGEERDNIYEVCEPFLIKEGFIIRTPKGRKATKAAYEHMGITYIEEGGDG